MFRLDDEFLNEIGKGDMPEAEKLALLEHLQEELEERVGARISENLSEEQIEEFEKIIDGDQDTIKAFLDGLGDYKNDPTYQKFLQIGATDDSPELLGEYVSLKWLDQNCPNYKEIATEVTSELKAEVTSSKDSI
ncbi:MAG: DUF5663 domain-containing protein [Candidatus Nomurabacteria bacterium]|jgi:hypothetical protein|nr:DUF5663 domain-containing protein [Candidatus Nomurabacteria bacterium]